MKKQISALALFLMASSAFATNFGSSFNTANDIKSNAGLNAEVGVASNLVYNGHTLTKKNPTVYLNSSAKMNTANGVLGVEFDAAKVNSAVNTSNVQEDAYLTYGTNFGALNFVGKAGEHRFGGLNERLADTKTVLVGAEYHGVFASAEKVVGTRGNQTFDTTEKVGYTYNLGDKLALTGLATFVQTGKASTTKFDHMQVSADYALTKAITLTALATKGGRTLAGKSVPSQYAVAASYTF